MRVAPSSITIEAVGEVESAVSPLFISSTETKPDGFEKVSDCTCGAGKPATCVCCLGRKVDWKKVPGSIRPMSRPGNFSIPPSGCDYYSLYDRVFGHLRDKPQPSGYPAFALMPPSFFDADFRYVESLPYHERTLVEKLKRIPLTDCLTLSTGGTAWLRYMNEHNSRLTETDNSYTLGRMRAFGDLMYGDRARVYGEYIWADSFSEELAPLAIDVNRGDILNLFLEVNLFEWAGKPVYGRVGRQELLLGSQRLVSTLEWANTRRTFDGVRLMRNGEKWDTDLFYTAFVPVNPTGFDQLDDNQEFGGAWATYRPEKGHFIDFYYLYFDNTNTVNQLPAPATIARAPTEIHSFGTRYAGDRDGFLWEYELTMQFGDQAGQELLAGAAAAGLGRNFKCHSWNPTLWAYYDYASGDSNPGGGRATTFNQLFPFGHYYLGWADQVGRQNIHDVNAHLFLYPEAWITVWLQYHHFWLDSATDALYNAGGVAIRRDPTGAAGTNVGDEIDIVLNFHLTRYSDILVGYAHLFGGGFLQATSSATQAANQESLYLMFQQKW